MSQDYRFFGISGIPRPIRKTELAKHVLIVPFKRGVEPAALVSRVAKPRDYSEVTQTECKEVTAFLEIEPQAMEAYGLPSNDIARCVCSALQVAGHHNVRSPYATVQPLHDFNNKRTLPERLFPWKGEGPLPRRKQFDDNFFPPERVEPRHILADRALQAYASDVSTLPDAMEALDYHRFIAIDKFALAALWVGLEAFLNPTDQKEAVSLRIALTAAIHLDLGQERGLRVAEDFARVQDIYGSRSDVVHGKPVPDAEVKTALTESYRLLKALIQRSLEHPNTPVRVAWKDHLDALLAIPPQG